MSTVGMCNERGPEYGLIYRPLHQGALGSTSSAVAAPFVSVAFERPSEDCRSKLEQFHMPQPWSFRIKVAPAQLVARPQCAAEFQCFAGHMPSENFNTRLMRAINGLPTTAAQRAAKLELVSCLKPPVHLQLEVGCAFSISLLLATSNFLLILQSSEAAYVVNKVGPALTV